MSREEINTPLGLFCQNINQEKWWGDNQCYAVIQQNRAYSAGVTILIKDIANLATIRVVGTISSRQMILFIIPGNLPMRLRSHKQLDSIQKRNSVPILYPVFPSKTGDQSSVFLNGTSVRRHGNQYIYMSGDSGAKHDKGELSRMTLFCNAINIPTAQKNRNRIALFIHVIEQKDW